jgi:hypothetical protein
VKKKSSYFLRKTAFVVSVFQNHSRWRIHIETAVVLPLGQIIGADVFQKVVSSDAAGSSAPFLENLHLCRVNVVVELADGAGFGERRLKLGDANAILALQMTVCDEVHELLFAFSELIVVLFLRKGSFLFLIIFNVSQ